MDDGWMKILDWLPEVLPWVITAAIVLPTLIVTVRRLTRGHVRKSDCTVATVGFIRSMEETGMYINDNPQIRFTVDAVAEDGTVFESRLQKVIPITQTAAFGPGVAIAMRYNPDDPARAVWDDNPDIALAQERVARYQSRKHPGDLTYEQRMELARNGVMKKALLESFRLTGREEGGDWEAEAAVRIPDEMAGEIEAKRTLYVTNGALDYLIPGKYVDVLVVPGRERLFGFAIDAAVDSAPDRDGR